jgi:hypothetical protein
MSSRQRNVVAGGRFRARLAHFCCSWWKGSRSPVRPPVAFHVALKSYSRRTWRSSWGASRCSPCGLAKVKPLGRTRLAITGFRNERRKVEEASSHDAAVSTIFAAQRFSDMRPLVVVGIAPQRAELFRGHTVAASHGSVQSLLRRDARCLPRVRPAIRFDQRAQEATDLPRSRASDSDSQRVGGHRRFLLGDVSCGRPWRRSSDSQASRADRERCRTWRPAAQDPKRQPRRRRVVKRAWTCNRFLPVAVQGQRGGRLLPSKRAGAGAGTFLPRCPRA